MSHRPRNPWDAGDDFQEFLAFSLLFAWGPFCTVPWPWVMPAMLAGVVGAYLLIYRSPATTSRPPAVTRTDLMALRRYANRRDANENEIVAALEAIGCTVLPMNVVDLLVGVGGKGGPANLLLEIKDGGKSPSRRKLTPAQIRFRSNWRGQYDVVTSVDEAIAAVQRHTLGR